MLTCADARSTRLRFETSDLRPDESTTNVGRFKAGTGSVLEYVDKLLLTLVGPDEEAPRPAHNPTVDLRHGETDCAPRPAGRVTPRILHGRLIELTELGLWHTIAERRPSPTTRRLPAETELTRS